MHTNKSNDQVKQNKRAQSETLGHDLIIRRWLQFCGAQSRSLQAKEGLRIVPERN